MLQSSTYTFLKALKKNNNKPWFDKNRITYESARSDFYEVVDGLIAGIAKFDPAIGSLKAKDCTFRINRDIRFSKDKIPYKTNLAAWFSKGGKKSNDAGYYFHFEPGKSFAAGGIYVPEAPQLAKIRQEIDYSFNEWDNIVGNKTFKKYFPDGIDGITVLSRPPKGYDETNPAIYYLKMKSFIVKRAFSDSELQDKNAMKEIIKTFEAMKPLINFLSKSVE